MRMERHQTDRKNNRRLCVVLRGLQGEEIFYKITLVPSDSKAPAKYLLDDPWGGEKDKVLVERLR